MKVQYSCYINIFLIIFEDVRSAFVKENHRSSSTFVAVTVYASSISSNVLPFVSTTLKYIEATLKTPIDANPKYVDLMPICSIAYGKFKLTMKLDPKFKSVAMPTACERTFVGNTSPTNNHAIGPKLT